MATMTTAQLTVALKAAQDRLDAFNARADAIEKLLAGPLVQEFVYDTNGQMLGVRLVLANDPTQAIPAK